MPKRKKKVETEKPDSGKLCKVKRLPPKTDSGKLCKVKRLKKK